MTFFAIYLVLIALFIAVLTRVSTFRRPPPHKRRSAERPGDTLAPWASIHEISEAEKRSEHLEEAA
jgi:hypothetical protein